MDNGWLLPGNAGYGEVSQGGRMHNGRDGVRRIGCLRPEARCFFRQILYAADSLANVLEHDERDWGKDSLRKALALCIEVLQAI